MTYPWSGQGKKLTDYDIPRIGKRIGVGEDEIHSILDVETRGYGFDTHGVIRLFESHVFYRQLPKHKRSEAVAKGLAHPSWGAAKRAGNYKNNYVRLIKAYQYDSKAAVESCSWGLGQVMGFNHKMCGYNSAMEMVEDFAKSEAKQLEGMVEFIISAGLDDELRAHNWAGFARGYNGAGYRANKYDTRLKQRYEWWKKQPDTEWTPASAAGEEIEHEDTQETLAENTKQTVTPVLAAGGGGLAVVASTGLPLWAQAFLGFLVFAITVYVILDKMGDDE